MDIVAIIKDYLRSENLQEFVNNRFWDTNRLVIPQLKDKNGKYDFSTWMKVVSHDGKTFFYWDELVTTIGSVKYEYSYDDIRKDDIVLDIGGCIGAYGLQICHDVRHVYIVEPLLNDRIKRNIDLTNSINDSIFNVDVFKCALGLGGNIEITFQGGKVFVPSYSLNQLKEMCGGHVDVLKCDCEGGEWNIQPKELEGIRRIEMEVHIGESFEYHGGTSRKDDVKKIIYSDKRYTFSDYINMLNDVGFECTHTILDEHTCLIHGTRVEI